MNKIAIFVDVQNIYYTTRDTFDRQFNYQKLWQRISNEKRGQAALGYPIPAALMHPCMSFIFYIKRLLQLLRLLQAGRLLHQ